MKVNGFILLAIAMIGTSCVARSNTLRHITIDDQSDKISGRLSTRGEWAIFPYSFEDNYSPIGKNENSKCVSIINGSGKPESNFRRFSGKNVTIFGRAIRYDSLPIGINDYDKLLSKRYFEKTVVENFCLREYVFLYHDIERSP
jgi:hypothetical protein